MIKTKSLTVIVSHAEKSNEVSSQPREMKSRNSGLLLIKILHTAVWVFFNVVLMYLFYAAITGKIDLRVWVGIGLFGVEGIILLHFKNTCPLTILARKFSASTKDNFDIFLPDWLARNNKLIYSILLGICILIVIHRLLRG
jgi:hypothetical protein